MIILNLIEQIGSNHEFHGGEDVYKIIFLLKIYSCVADKIIPVSFLALSVKFVSFSFQSTALSPLIIDFYLYFELTSI